MSNGSNTTAATTTTVITTTAQVIEATPTPGLIIGICLAGVFVLMLVVYCLIPRPKTGAGIMRRIPDNVARDTQRRLLSNNVPRHALVQQPPMSLRKGQ
jgi:hypothetical protein